MDKSVIVRLKDIVMNFDDEQVLKGIDLDIHDKEFITLLGPSGCGKTNGRSTRFSKSTHFSPI